MTFRNGTFSTVQLVVAGLALSACHTLSAQPPGGFVSFEKTEIDAEFPGGYGVEIADLDADGREDIIALATSPAQLSWYKNPGWEKRPVNVESSGNIDIAPYDINADGRMDMVLASDFNLRNPDAGGLVQWLENPGDLQNNPPWIVHPIDEVPTSHRIKWAEINGAGRQELVNLPIIGAGAQAPTYEGGAELRVYSIPEDPAAEWGAVTVEDSLEMAHGLAILDWDEDGRDDMLTASFSGVDVFQLAVRGQFVARNPLIEAQPGTRPATGISELAAGNAGTGQGLFLATIEPWHGNEVVVYRPDPNNSIVREVIHDELQGGHALLTVDLDNDGYDEIVAGGRSQPYSLAIFRFNERNGRWRRIEVDDGTAVSGLDVADLNGDGFQDLVAVGSATGNVVVYMNSGTQGRSAR